MPLLSVLPTPHGAKSDPWGVGGPPPVRRGETSGERELVRALVLDDEPVARMILCDRLAAAGCSVESCGDARTALALADERDFDLVLLDWVLPGSTSGLDVCRGIRNGARNRDAVIVMVTARDDASSLATALEDGADDYLPKPMPPSMLDVRLQVALKRVREVRKGRAAEEQRLELDEKLRAIVENSPDAIFIKDVAGRYRLMNRAGAALLGKTVDEMIGHDDEELFDPRTAEHQRSGDDRVLDGVGPFTHTSTLTLGSDVRALMTTKFQFRADDGELLGIIGMSRDVSQLKRAEAELVRSEKRFSLAAEGARDGVWDWNLRTDEVFFTARWRQQLGLPKQDGYASNDLWLDRVHPADAGSLRAAIDDHLLGRSDALRHEYRVLHEDGGYRWMQARAKSVADEHGRQWRLVGSQSDVSTGKLQDPVTGLPNRQGFLDRIESALEGDRGGYSAVVVSVQGLEAALALGRESAEHAVITLAERLLVFEAEGHVVARLGDYDFGVALSGIHEPRAAERMAHSIQRVVTQPLVLADGGEIPITASIGVALSTVGDGADDTVLRDAYLALRRAEARGTGRFQVYEVEMHAKALRRIEQVGALRRALADEEEQIKLLCQPIVELQTGRLSGFEALVRWHHPVLGVVSPNDFIPIAEETKLVVPLGRRVLRQACEKIGRWRQFPGCNHVTMAVNVAACELTESGFADGVFQTLALTGAHPTMLHLEVTESGMFDDFRAALAALDQVTAGGVRISIDDFGTGHSSLAYVHRLPASTLKIDRSFVSQLGEDAHALEIVRAIIAVAQSLDLRVVAEGIESAEQWDMLRRMGCSHGQGYLFGRPLDEDEVETLLRGTSTRSRWELPETLR